VGPERAFVTGIVDSTTPLVATGVEFEPSPAARSRPDWPLAAPVGGGAEDAAMFPPVDIGETATLPARSRTDHNPAIAPNVLPMSAATVAFLRIRDLRRIDAAVVENLTGSDSPQRE
jgi:hypothetical protein